MATTARRVFLFLYKKNILPLISCEVLPVFGGLDIASARHNFDLASCEPDLIQTTLMNFHPSHCHTHLMAKCSHDLDQKIRIFSLYKHSITLSMPRELLYRTAAFDKHN